ncbi:MAG: hypothetical protein ACK4MF_01740 [Hyphomicrobiaceae bacterium]
MIRRAVLAAAFVTAFGFAVPVSFSTSASATEVAGRPALPTTSTEDLIKLRSTWGTAPSK